MRFYLEFGPRREFKDYEPGDDLEQQIADHRNDPGAPCGFVECPYLHPDYRAFDESQLSYYLYVRDSLRNGTPIRSDVGYSWLLLEELINDRGDPPAVMEQLMKVYDASCDMDQGYPAPATVSEIMFNYAIANDLDLPRICTFDEVFRKALISEVLLPYPEPIAADEFRSIVGYPMEDYYNEDAEDLHPEELFDAALPAVDDAMRGSTGKGILDTYATGTRTSALKLFDIRYYDMVYFRGDERTSISYTDSDGSLQLFLGAMFRYCVRVMEKDAGVGKGPSVSSVFGKDLRRVVDKVFGSRGTAEPSYRPKPSRSTVRGSPDDGGRPFVTPLESDARYTLGRTFRADMQRYSEAASEGPCSYVCSGCSKPEYARMRPEALAYYLYWRDQARGGTYLMTDEGYLWLYQCELINDDREDYVLDQLKGLAKAYDGFFEDYDSPWTPSKRPGRTYMDYAFVRSLMIPDPTVYPCILTACDMMDSMLMGDDTPYNAQCFLILAGLSPDRKSDKILIASFGEECADVAARVVPRIDTEGRKKPGRIKGYCYLREKDVKMNVFGNLKYYGWPKGCRRAYDRMVLNCVYNDHFTEEMRTLLKTIVKAMDSRGRSMKPVLAFGIDISGMVQEEVEAVVRERASGRAAEEARTMVIDREGVDRAAADLDHVTRLVGIEERSDEEPVEAEAVAMEASGDPWADLASRLDGDQAEYLRKALDGTLRAAKPTMEGAINGIAMDTVKDAVIENGSVYDEYVEDIAKALGRSPR